MSDRPADNFGSIMDRLTRSLARQTREAIERHVKKALASNGADLDDYKGLQKRVKIHRYVDQTRQVDYKLDGRLILSLLDPVIGPTEYREDGTVWIRYDFEAAHFGPDDVLPDTRRDGSAIIPRMTGTGPSR